MIFYLVTKPHAYTMRTYLADWGRALAERITIVPYAQFVARDKQPRGSYIFSDLDRVKPAWLPRLQQHWDELGRTGNARKLLNEPARVMTRLPLLQALHATGVNDFDAYPIEPNKPPMPARFPVFIREANDHKGPVTELIRNQSELVQYLEYCARAGKLSGAPIVVEFVDTADACGIYRKYSAFRFGDHIVPAHIVTGRDWVVKSTNSERGARYIAEELDYVASNPHAAELMTLFSIANIDYGRIDYSLRGGRIQVFEINTNPIIMHPGESSNPQRTKKRRITAAAIERALLSLDESAQ